MFENWLVMLQSANVIIKLVLLVWLFFQWFYGYGYFAPQEAIASELQAAGGPAGVAAMMAGGRAPSQILLDIARNTGLFVGVLVASLIIDGIVLWQPKFKLPSLGRSSAPSGASAFQGTSAYKSHSPLYATKTAASSTGPSEMAELI
jgi:hypothetical protein